MNIRPRRTRTTRSFEMLYEAAAWNPDWPRERRIAALADPMLERYHRDWGREGDAGVIAELDRRAGRVRGTACSPPSSPGTGSTKTPELGMRSSRCIGARASATRSCAP